MQHAGVTQQGRLASSNISPHTTPDQPSLPEILLTARLSTQKGGKHSSSLHASDLSRHGLKLGTSSETLVPGGHLRGRPPPAARALKAPTRKARLQFSLQTSSLIS